MKTTIEFTDGRIEDAPDTAPHVSLDERILYLINEGDVVMTEDLPLNTIKRVVFEP